MMSFAWLPRLADFLIKYMTLVRFCVWGTLFGLFLLLVPDNWLLLLKGQNSITKEIVIYTCIVWFTAGCICGLITLYLEQWYQKRQKIKEANAKENSRQEKIRNHLTTLSVWEKKIIYDAYHNKSTTVISDTRDDGNIYRVQFGITPLLIKGLLEEQPQYNNDIYVRIFIIPNFIWKAIQNNPELIKPNEEPNAL